MTALLRSIWVCRTHTSRVADRCTQGKPFHLGTDGATLRLPRAAPYLLLGPADHQRGLRWPSTRANEFLRLFGKLKIALLLGLTKRVVIPSLMERELSTSGALSLCPAVATVRTNSMRPERVPHGPATWYAFPQVFRLRTICACRAVNLRVFLHRAESLFYEASGKPRVATLSRRFHALADHRPTIPVFFEGVVECRVSLHNPQLRRASLLARALLILTA